MAKHQPKPRPKAAAKPNGRPKPRAAARRKAVRKLTAATPAAPFPSIVSPASGTKVDGGTTLRLQVSTNRPDVQHYVRLLDPATQNPITGTQNTVDFSGGSPTTATVTIPAAGTADTDYIVQIYTTATPPGTPGTILITVPAAAMSADIGPDPEPDGDGAYPTDTDVRFTADMSGRTGTFTYTWVLERPVDPPDVFTTDAQDYYDITLAHEGSYRVRVFVEDADAPGLAAAAEFEFTAYS